MKINLIKMMCTCTCTLLFFSEIAKSNKSLQDFVYCIKSNKSSTITTQSQSINLNQCDCDSDYPISLVDRFCLPRKQINQTCYISSQCSDVDWDSTGCFIGDKLIQYDYEALKLLIQHRTGKHSNKISIHEILFTFNKISKLK